MTVRGIEGLPDNITLGLHRTNNTSIVAEKTKEKPSRRGSLQSHTLSETDVNIGYTGLDMKRELQIRFGKLEAAEMSLQVCTLTKISFRKGYKQINHWNFSVSLGGWGQNGVIFQ